MPRLLQTALPPKCRREPKRRSHRTHARSALAKPASTRKNTPRPPQAPSNAPAKPPSPRLQGARSRPTERRFERSSKRRRTSVQTSGHLSLALRCWLGPSRVAVELAASGSALVWSSVIAGVGCLVDCWLGWIWALSTGSGEILGGWCRQSESLGCGSRVAFWWEWAAAGRAAGRVRCMFLVWALLRFWAVWDRCF